MSDKDSEADKDNILQNPLRQERKKKGTGAMTGNLLVL
jgi:hypothetical protein